MTTIAFESFETNSTWGRIFCNSVHVGTWYRPAKGANSSMVKDFEAPEGTTLLAMCYLLISSPRIEDHLYAFCGSDVDSFVEAGIVHYREVSMPTEDLLDLLAETGEPEEEVLLTSLEDPLIVQIP